MHKDRTVAFYEEFGLRAARQRRLAQLSQAEVAQHVGLTRASISNLEAGRQRPLLHQVVAICQLLDCDISALTPAIDANYDQDKRRLDNMRQRFVAGGQSADV